MAHPSRLSRLPPWLSHCLGYRSIPVPKQSDYTIWIWAFIGSFLGISLIQAVFSQARYFVERGVPSIVASYGASAVLIYGAIDVPLAQPRALFGGHFLGALTGICITKLFHLLPTEERFQDLLWLAGSLSCATSVVVMHMTGTTHPPAGATALLAALNPDIRQMGWYYLPVVLLTSTLALVVALITNNIQRRYPVFWFHPAISAPKVSETPASIESPQTMEALAEKKGNATAASFAV
ncbi:HPP family-domain-containing protein [Crassisporium funariophilum]|nr:HPP family-domain-containing protein [Crassisporium funariophilum]